MVKDDLKLKLLGVVQLTALVFGMTRFKYSERDSNFVDKIVAMLEKFGLSSDFNSQHLDIISDLNDMNTANLHSYTKKF